MLISYEKKFIFIHVAKVAGISIREVLEPYCEEPEHFKITRPSHTLQDGTPNRMYELWSNTLWHAKARDVRKEFPQVFDDFYTFSFVRNPWDWQVSMYHFILKRTDHIHYARVSAMRDFEEYLEWVIATRNPFPKGATKLQKDMVTDKDGNITVDFLGRFETLSKDFQQVCDKIGVQAASLPERNRSVHKAYTGYYNERSKKRVAEHFKADIELFDYRFGESEF